MLIENQLVEQSQTEADTIYFFENNLSHRCLILTGDSKRWIYGAKSIRHVAYLISVGLYHVHCRSQLHSASAGCFHPPSSSYLLTKEPILRYFFSKQRIWIETISCVMTTHYILMASTTTGSVYDSSQVQI